MNRSRSGPRRPPPQVFGASKKSNVGYKGAAAAVTVGRRGTDTTSTGAGDGHTRSTSRRKGDSNTKKEAPGVNKGHGVLIKTWGSVSTSATVSERGMSFAEILKMKSQGAPKQEPSTSITIGNGVATATTTTATTTATTDSENSVPSKRKEKAPAAAPNDTAPFNWEDEDEPTSKNSTPLIAPAQARPIDEAMVAASVATTTPTKPVFRSHSASKKSPAAVKGITETQRGRARDERPPTGERKRSRSAPRNRSPSQQRAQARYEELSDKVVLPFDVKLTKKSAFSFSGVGVEDNQQQPDSEPPKKPSAKSKSSASKKISAKKKASATKAPAPTPPSDAKKPSENKKEKKKKRIAAAKEAARLEKEAAAAAAATEAPAPTPAAPETAPKKTPKKKPDLTPEQIAHKKSQKAEKKAARKARAVAAKQAEVELAEKEKAQRSTSETAKQEQPRSHSLTLRPDAHKAPPFIPKDYNRSNWGLALGSVESETTHLGLHLKPDNANSTEPQMAFSAHAKPFYPGAFKEPSQGLAKEHQQPEIPGQKKVFNRSGWGPSNYTAAPIATPPVAVPGAPPSTWLGAHADYPQSSFVGTDIKIGGAAGKPSAPAIVKTGGSAPTVSSQQPKPTPAAAPTAPSELPWSSWAGSAAAKTEAVPVPVAQPQHQPQQQQQQQQPAPYLRPTTAVSAAYPAAYPSAGATPWANPQLASWPQQSAYTNYYHNAAANAAFSNYVTTSAAPTVGKPMQPPATVGNSSAFLVAHQQAQAAINKKKAHTTSKTTVPETTARGNWGSAIQKSD